MARVRRDGTRRAAGHGNLRSMSMSGGINGMTEAGSVSRDADRTKCLPTTFSSLASGNSVRGTLCDSASETLLFSWEEIFDSSLVFTWAELRSSDKLGVGDVLLSRDGSYMGYVDSTRGTLVVEARPEAGSAGGYWWAGTHGQEEGRVEWEAPTSWADAGKLEQQAAYITLTSRGVLELRAVGRRGNERLMWASSAEGSLAEDWSLPHRYMLVLEDKGGHGNLVLYSETGLERECIWASAGCEDDLLDTLMLRRMSNKLRGLGPLIGRLGVGCGRVFCVVRDKLLVKAKIVKPQLSKGVKRLQELMRKTARRAVSELFRRFQASPVSNSE